jgi:hypothetical protein
MKILCNVTTGRTAYRTNYVGCHTLLISNSNIMGRTITRKLYSTVYRVFALYRVSFDYVI